MTMDFNVMHTDPIDVPKTQRAHPIVVATSMPAGKVVPLVAIPMLREDAYNGALTVKVEMQETKELLMNGVTLRVTAYVVPWLAFERFQGSRDQFDRSWMGQPKDKDPAAPVTPFIETAVFGAHGSNKVYSYLGMHAKPTDLVNTMYLEAYNLIDRFRATNRSRKLSQRTRLQTDLAPAFWGHGRFKHIVPDFNQARIDGQVALNIVNEKMPVRGMALVGTTQFPASISGRFTDGTTTSASGWKVTDVADGSLTPGNQSLMVVSNPANPNYPLIYAEMQQNGVTVSLSTIDQAKQTAAFARLREQYEGLQDDYIVDMLMDGLSIPEQALKQPILIGDATTVFSQAKRYATDSGNLAESATSGMAQVSMNLRVPRLGTGGVIMVLAEAVPVQLFERQRDPFLHTQTTAEFPSYLRDHLDTEKVDVVYNRDIDTDHDTPNDHFGYAPLNWKWTSFGARVGGDFLRPTVDAAIDDLRMAIWAVETENPELAEDFYRVGGTMHIKPFLDATHDPFRVSCAGNGVLTGNTVFGPLLPEAKDDNYEKVAAKAPATQIVKP